MVEGNDKKRARLNCMAHLLGQIPYGEVPHEPVVLPAREKTPTTFVGLFLQKCLCPRPTRPMTH